MELIIKKTTFPEAIEFNYEELKQEIVATSAKYANMVYTDETMKEAKADRAKLNKFCDALSAERIKVKKKCLEPYDDFEKKIKELTGIVGEPIREIDDQVKAYEQKQKEEKKAQIEEIWETEKSELTADIPLAKIWDEKWLNTSTSIKKVKEDIRDAIGKINTDLKTLGMLPDFAFEAKEYYLRTLDITAAITEGKRLADIQARKQAYEAEQARIKAEEEARQPEPQPVQAAEAIEEAPQTVEPDRQWYNFSAFLSIDEAQRLGNFCRNSNIKLKRI